MQFLDPPFDKSDLNPGYIKGYVPGVRENGGQYTHAAIWAAMAFAKLGDSKKAWELLNIINPVNHARSPEEVAMYKVNLMLLRLMFTLCRRISVRVDGHGIQDLPAGCTV